MSLFPSSFDTAAGPSSLSSPALGRVHKDGKNRKKSNPPRPNTNGHAGFSRGNVRSVEANLAKVMRRVEAGDIKEKGVIGGDNMGQNRKGKNKKPDTGVDEGPLSQQDGQSSNKKRKRGGDQSGTSKMAEESDKREKSMVEMKNGHIGPAEIPLPHNLPKKKGKTDSNGLMTDMQKDMQSKLEGARFRWINEQLYSHDSAEAVEMMKKDPKIFEDYHQTHRALTSAWPSPPLPHLITLLTPLPPKTLIVDLGCGDAGLAKALVPQGKIVLSYDLVGDSGTPATSSGSGVADGTQDGVGSGGWVVEADFLSHIPLPGRPGGRAAGGDEDEEPKKRKKGKGKGQGKDQSEVVDVVVCCLSLMGLNWVGGIYEACRVLKQHGTLQIAEVTSRFISTSTFITKIETFGFKLKSQSSPSTHFTLFEFVKESEVPVGPIRNELGWDARVKEGENILRGCVYKKR